MANTFKDFINRNRIKVPRLQREFAFGRLDNVSKVKRERFIDAIFEAVSNSKSLYLNFVYGTSSESVFVPLDGQQRLTILYMLHWYYLKKNDDENFLVTNEGKSKLSYDTRYSSTVFFDNLVQFVPDRLVTNTVVNQIQDQSWFELAWKHDANISGVLTVLDYIEQKDKLSSNPIFINDFKVITFDNIDIEAYEMSDDIYIKINSRGKQLTEFENFKAAFLEKLKTINKDLHLEIAYKFDNEWSQIFWHLVDLPKDNTPPGQEDNTPAKQLDEMMFNYIRYISQVLIWEKSLDDTIDVNEGYSLISNTSKIFENEEDFHYFKKWFDIFIDIQGFEEWCNKQFYESKEPQASNFGKIRLWQDTNFLKKLVTGNSSRASQALFYALAIYLMNQEAIEESEFRLRFRTIRNLLEAGDKNSYNNTLRYSASANDMTAALNFINSFMLGRDIDKDMENTRFRKGQIQYEQEKNEWISANPDFSKFVFTLEDSNEIHGITENIGFKDQQLLNIYTELVLTGGLQLTKILLSYEYPFDFKNNNATYFPTNTSINSNYYRGYYSPELLLNEKLISILKDKSISELREHPKVYMNECVKKQKFTPEYYALKYSKHFIQNNEVDYQFGNVRNFSEIGICLTNKSNSQWHNYRSTVLLTIINNVKNVKVEWLEDGTGLTWANGKVIKSIIKGFEIVDGTKVELIITKENDTQYDFEDRINKAIKIIELQSTKMT